MNYKMVCKEYNVDLDVLQMSFSSLFPEILMLEILQVINRSLKS